MQGLLKFVEVFLPVNWFCIQDEDDLQVSMLSTGFPRVTQRCISVSRNGILKISVHGRELKPDHPLLSSLPKLRCLTAENVKEMADKIASVIARVRQYEICVGANDKDHSRLWKRMTDSFIDDNNFRETKYSQVCRSNNCEYLIHQRATRCKQCGALSKNIARKFKRNIGKLDKTPNKHKPDKHLATPEIRRRAVRRVKNNINTRKQNQRLRDKIAKLLDREGEFIDEELSKNLTDAMKANGLTEFQKLFINQQIMASKVKSARGRRWHPAFIRFALDIQTHSPKDYEILGKYVTLPSERMLFDYSHVSESTEGICCNTIEDISKKIVETGMEEFQTYHSLYYDEVYISQNIVFNKHTGKMTGYCNLSNADKELQEIEQLLASESDQQVIDETPPVATKILAFMVKGTASGICEVVASFPVNNLTKEDLFHKHWSVVEACETAGIKIICSVGDGCPINRAFVDMHCPNTKTKSGVVYDTLNPCNDREFYFFSDPPHLLKTIRNNFMSKARTLTKNGQVITWKTIIRLYHFQKGDTLRKCYKLNAQVVFPSSYAKMRVQYAAQVLSVSVANLLQQMKWVGTEETITFIRKVNEFFDILNGNYSFEGIRKKNDDLKPFKDVNDDRFKALQGFLKYLHDWSEEIEKLPLKAEEKERMQLCRQTLCGIEMTCLAFIDCVRFLLRQGTSFIMARVFSQDYLEHYFSRQRAKCGSSNNPNVTEYFRNQNTFRVMGQVRVNRKRANVQIEENASLIDSTPLPKRAKTSKKSLAFDG